MIEKKVAKVKSVACKITAEQDTKLIKLAAKMGVTKSSLIAQLIGIAYMEVSKNKVF
jgi:hypothetical protein